MTVLAVCAALAGALCFALAAALQQYAAGQAPPAAGVRLMTHLVRRKAWLAGVTAMLCGVGLHLLALGHGPLLLVQPLGVSAVVFTLPMAAVLRGRRVRWREWAAAAMVTVALCGVLYLVPARPGGTPALPGVLALAGAALAGSAALGSIARACTGAARAPLFAIGTGVAFGTVSSLARIMLTAGSGELIGVAAVAVVPLAVLGFVLSQHAYQAGGAAVVLATITVTDPATAVAAGALVLNETVPTSPVRWGLAACCAALIVAGVMVLARATTRRTGDGRGTEPPGAPGLANRVVIITAGVGAGHDGAAAQLALRLADQGFTVERHDLLDLLPLRLGAAVAWTYHRMLTWAPWAYQRLFASTERTMKAAGRPGLLVRGLLRCAEPGVRNVLPADTAVVVSTYFGASQVLGRLRRTGRLPAPVVTYLTDMSVHPLWVAPGADAHLAIHPVAAAQARALGAAGVQVTGPVVDARFTPAPAVRRAEARARFGLPGDGRLALLVAGSWGVGPVREAALDVRASGVAEPVVVCGRNVALAERLRADGITHAFGWVHDMPALIGAADVLVQNAGGLTSLEALAAGLPVATYGCIPGHGHANAAALSEAGLATWIRDANQLGGVLAELLDGPDGRHQRAAGLALFARVPGPADVIAQAARADAADAAQSPAGTVVRPRRSRSRRPAPDRPVTRRRARPALRLLSLVAVFPAALWLSTAGTEMAVAHGAFGAVTSPASGAYLVVHPPEHGTLDTATIHALRDDHAAVAVDIRQAADHPAQIQSLARAGVPLVNAGGGPPYTTGVLARRGAITTGATTLRRLTGTRPRFYLSSGDVDAIDVSLARRDGERLLIPGRRLPCDTTAVPALRPRRVTFVECATGTPGSLTATLRRLHAAAVLAVRSPISPSRPTRGSRR